MIKLTKAILYRHIVIWCCLILLIVYFDFVSGLTIAKLSYVPIFVLNCFCTYYALLLFVLPLLLRKKYVIFTLCFATTISSFVLYDYIHLKVVLPFLGGETRRSLLSTIPFLENSLLLFSFVGFSAIGSFMNWRSSYRLNQSLEIEKDILSRELNYLKNQFHSHLTFNFLNFCYGKMLNSSRQVADSIETFSEMLRYPLVNKMGNYLPLDEEIEYIKCFIDIQKCITSDLNIEFNYETDANDYYILPMILAIFVENAFKHGTFDYQKPISLLLYAKDGKIRFQVKNYKIECKTIGSSGIGLESVKQLLGIFYYNKHSLSIENEDEIYCSHLTLETL